MQPKMIEAAYKNECLHKQLKGENDYAKYDTETKTWIPAMSKF